MASRLSKTARERLEWSFYVGVAEYFEGDTVRHIAQALQAGVGDATEMSDDDLLETFAIDGRADDPEWMVEGKAVTEELRRELQPLLDSMAREDAEAGGEPEGA